MHMENLKSFILIIKSVLVGHARFFRTRNKNVKRLKQGKFVFKMVPLIKL